VVPGEEDGLEAQDTDTATVKRRSLEEEFSAYLPHIRQRWLAQQSAWRSRQEEAWEAAREVATILRTRFAADEVIAFGSLVHTGHFSDRSDIDLAVSGIQPADFFKAWAAAGEACPFELDLVDLSDCSSVLRDLIEREGRPL
jgi:predicted nucleotidyltransferase